MQTCRYVGQFLVGGGVSQARQAGQCGAVPHRSLTRPRALYRRTAEVGGGRGIAEVAVDPLLPQSLRA